MRRRPLFLLVPILLLLRLAANAAAEEAPLPTVEIAPGIHVHEGAQADADARNGNAIANVGFIVGDREVMVVDPGGSAREGARLRAAVRAVTDLPVRHVVLTHVHPDHILGAAAFAGDGAEVIGHAKLPGALAQRGAYYLQTLRRAIGEEAAGSAIVLPTRTVERTITIDLGGREVEIEAHGPAHTDNDLSLFDRNTRTLWLGDLLFVDRIPVIDGSLVGWLRELDRLKATIADRAVPGHGPVSAPWPQAAAPEERYLRSVLAGTRRALADHVDIGEAPSRVAGEERGRWLLFDEYHARNVTAAYKELEWE